MLAGLVWSLADQYASGRMRGAYSRLQAAGPRHPGPLAPGEHLGPPFVSLW